MAAEVAALTRKGHGPGRSRRSGVRCTPYVTGGGMGHGGWRGGDFSLVCGEVLRCAQHDTRGAGANSKSETRNPKQIQSTKGQCRKSPRQGGGVRCTPYVTTNGVPRSPKIRDEPFFLGRGEVLRWAPHDKGERGKIRNPKYDPPRADETNSKHEAPMSQITPPGGWCAVRTLRDSA